MSELKIDLGKLEFVGETSESHVLEISEKVTREALEDYFEDNNVMAQVDRTDATSDNPQQDGGATIATVVVTAIVTAAAKEVGKIAVQEVVAAVKRYLRNNYGDKVNVRDAD